LLRYVIIIQYLIELTISHKACMTAHAAESAKERN
jgi:hypothetical protein